METEDGAWRVSGKVVGRDQPPTPTSVSCTKRVTFCDVVATLVCCSVQVQCCISGYQLSPVMTPGGRRCYYERDETKAQSVCDLQLVEPRLGRLGPQISPASEPKLLTSALCYCPGVHPPKVSDNWPKKGRRERARERKSWEERRDMGF